MEPHFHYREHRSFLGYCAVLSRRGSPTFQRCLLRPTSGRIILMIETGASSNVNLETWEDDPTAQRLYQRPSRKSDGFIVRATICQ